MRQIKFNTHISGRFNIELENLRNSLLTMAGAVEQQLIDALKALEQNHSALAESVILRDLEINSMELQIDEECLRIIAKRHPAASDLRLVMTVSKAIVDIERMGDEVERIAKLITHKSLPPNTAIKRNMMSIGERVVAMMRGTFDAFARQDEAAALEVYDQDNLIDSEYKALLNYIAQEINKREARVEEWFEFLWALRSLERIGDRCKNICEYVIYLNRGSDMRKEPIENMRKTLSSLQE